MKRLAMVICLSFLMSACGAREATYTDRDFGMAQYTMQSQIINPAPPFATVPEGVQSMDAERMMQARGNTYNYTPARLDVSKFEVLSSK